MQSLILSIVLPSIEPQLLGDRFAFEGARVFDDEVVTKTDRKILIWMSADDAETRLVHGKFQFGIDRNLQRDVRYLTVISHPVGRVVKDYEMISRKTGHALHETAKNSAGEISTFLRAPEAACLLNRHTAALAGTEGKGLAPNDPALLEIALRNLKENFLWVGCLETLGKNAAALAQIIGGEIQLTNGDAAISNPEVEAANALDVELHRICREGGWR